MTVAQQKQDNWHASLQLQYQLRDQTTILARRQHHGPLLVQRPFYPEAGVCHTYIIHPPGGVVGGDHLDIDVQVDSQAHALLTTPASGKFYNSQKRCSQLNQTLRVQEGGTLEWLPQDNIFFEGSHTVLNTQVELSADARFIGWDISCLGRPFSGKQFDNGHSEQRFVLSREGIPLVVDRTHFTAGQKMLTEKWGLADYPVVGTLLATPADKSLVDQLRTALKSSQDFEFSATLINGVLVCRFLGHHGEMARQHFEKAWRIVRPHVLGVEACAPRIWKT